MTLLIRRVVREESHAGKQQRKGVICLNYGKIRRRKTGL
jgi:hypothetical protein